MAKLLVHESAGVRELEIVDNEVHMGRELDNTLRLPDPSISRHHCVVRKVGGGFEIQDLQSSNGVMINGNRVQSSPLRDGDRITLGHVQLTFQDPRPEVHPTVAVSVQEAPAVPLGTVRMSPGELAAIHAVSVQAAPPGPLGTAPIATDELVGIHMGKLPADPGLNLQLQDQVTAASLAAQAQPATPPASRPTSLPAAPRPNFPAPSSPSIPTSPGVPMSQSFLGSLLPSVPDTAVPVGGRGDLVTRLLAVLIDIVPAIIISFAFMVLAFIPFLGCILMPLSLLAQLGYYFFFVPWTVSKFGASIGKKVMKLRVVPVGNPAGHIDLGIAILRQLGNFFFLNLIVLAIKGDERISLSDILAKTEVIKVDR